MGPEKDVTQDNSHSVDDEFGSCLNVVESGADTDQETEDYGA